MHEDRQRIVNIISDMLDNPDESGIYPTSTCFSRLEQEFVRVRLEAIGWCLAECCLALDRNDDPRTMEVPGIISRALNDLS